MTAIVFVAVVLAASLGLAGWAVAGEMNRPADTYPGCYRCDGHPDFACDCAGDCGRRGCPAVTLAAVRGIVADDAFEAGLDRLHAEIGGQDA